ncbi:putative vivid protein [Annulohypoxylon maeteangense]|uniref:putative vivid protein n=1 Tax=Annulohypoxylon maeteangense TaxID=1927788 RepID=UPI002008E332|nr:putative vivid protein [Annulohypoxylon maeteangense]KAI0887952.1 putative vivid protein [Annulohypoxylon maeteangense]
MAFIMNPWEENAFQYHYQDTSGVGSSSLAVNQQDDVHDSVIYPGLYAPSGFDMMSILVRVMSRPNPAIDLGPIDASCALIMCDLQEQDYPVVYASDPFMELTGYSQSEIIGRNCRFLQAPGGKVRQRSTRKYVDKDLIKKMRRAVESNNELAIEVTNFKKDGQSFVNLLSMIPVCWDSSTPRYSVGFLAEKTW